MKFAKRFSRVSNCTSDTSVLWCDTKKEGFDMFLVFLYANIRTSFKRMSLSLFLFFIAGDVIHRNRLTMSVLFVSTCDMFCQISLALSSVEHKNWLASFKIDLQHIYLLVRHKQVDWNKIVFEVFITLELATSAIDTSLSVKTENRERVWSSF